MTAYPKPDQERDHFDRLFCVVVSWLETTWPTQDDNPVYLWEADEETGKLVLIGDSTNCQEFHRRCAEIISNNPEIETWR